MAMTKAAAMSTRISRGIGGRGGAVSVGMTGQVSPKPSLPKSLQGVRPRPIGADEHSSAPFPERTCD